MSPVVHALSEFFNASSCKQYWVALSGGVDSTVLLHAAVMLSEQHEIALRAIHVNHHLQPQANNWQQHCEQFCADLNVPLIVANIDVTSQKGQSLEADARRARYASFQEKLPEGAHLLLAHHQDDQAETLLLQLLRGAGVKGLAAMPQQKIQGELFLHRPLLQVTKNEIDAYARAHQLSWVEDGSNQDKQYARNYLRHEVMPVLKHYWPAASANIARSAGLCAEADELLAELGANLLAQCVSASCHLVVDKVLTLSQAQQRLVLRHWIIENGFTLPSAIKMQLLQKTVLQAAEDKTPLLTWQGAEVRRFDGKLYVMSPLALHDAASQYAWALQTPLVLSHLNMTLSAQAAMGEGVLVSDVGDITIRFRQGGEAMVLPKRAGRRQLKKLFQEWDVPPWQRDRVPLLYVGNKLAAVVGYAISEDFLVRQGQQGWLIQCS